jgi:hypothetical protein
MSGETCYRNEAIEIAPGRFSRDSWRLEMFRAPDRGSGVNRGAGRPTALLPAMLRASKKKHGKYEADELANSNGLWKRESLLYEGPPRNRLYVIARCSGPACDGRITRKFHAYEWCRPSPMCGRCINAAKVEATHAKRNA